MKNAINRRSALKTIRSTGVISVLPEVALGFGTGEGRVVHEVAAPGMDPDAKPKYSIKFSY
jgi:hypothetical protein